MFAKYSVKKPYTVLVGVLLVIVLGVVSLMKMTADLLPSMDLQYALIITTDMGASPEKVEMEVTAPIEAAMATTTGIKNVSSMSYNSYSIVTCEYDDSVNMDSVVIEIQQSLDQISGSWGDHVGSPMIMKINPDMLPVMTAAVDVEGMSPLEITEYVENELIPAFESLEGVASASASGLLKETVMVTLDQTKIDAINSLVKKDVKGEFREPEAEINDAIAEIEEGKDALKEAPEQLSEVFDQTVEGKEQLIEAESELKKQLSQLEKQRPQLVEMKKLMDEQFAPGGPMEALKVQRKALADAITEAEEEPTPQALGKLVEALNAMLPEGTEIPGSGTEEEIPETEESAGVPSVTPEMQAAILVSKAKEALAEFDNQVLAQFAEVNKSGLVTVKTFDDIFKIPKALEKALEQLDDGIKQMEDALITLSEQKDMLGTATDTINLEAAKAAMEIGTAAGDLSVASKALEDAKEALKDAKEQALDSADMTGILTIDMLSGLLVAQNFDMPAGYAYDGDTQYLVRIGEAVESVEDLENLPLMDMGMDSVGLIYLKDVANIEVIDNSDETYAIINGNPGVTLSFEKQTGYSTGEVTDRLLERFDSLEKQNPDLNMTVLMDQGVYIDLIVKSVVQNMIIGAVLAVFVLILFLKDYRPTVVVGVSIPLSVIFAIVLMYFTDISLNMISLSGLMLGIGMLVDNSIVVIENIYRLRNEGMSIRKACVEGSNQVAGAITASTLTTVCVYVPIIFTEGMTKQLFVDLALTIAFTLFASLAVALTVVPAMSSYTLRKPKEIRTAGYDRMRAWYGKALEACLDHKWIVLLAAIVLLAGSTALSLSKGLNFMDMEMETNQLTVTVGAKDGEHLTFEELTERSDEVINLISEMEGIETIGASAGGDATAALLGGSSESVSMYILLEEDAEVTTSQVAEEISERTRYLDCEIATSTSSMDMSALYGSGISLQIKGRDLGTLQELAKEAAKILEDTEGTLEVQDGLDETTAQWTITVDKEKAAEYGLTVAQVYQLVYGEMASESSVTTISTDIKDYEVYLQTEGQSELVLEDIKNLTFTYTDKEGEESEIPLTDICTMEETTTLSTIYRDSQNRYLTVSCDIDEGHNVTLVGNEVKEKLETLEVPEGYEIEMAGEDEAIQEAMEQMVLMLLLAVIFIYLIMVAQFQSLLLPFIIMFTIPLAFTGGFLGLLTAGKEVSVIAMLGFVMLAGVIVNNGIVLIEYIAQARGEGKSKREAIVEAGVIRLRPILMTALTTILAMVPASLGFGEGAQTMQPMSITMVGGLLYGTVLTLIVIPCVYDLFTKEKKMTEEE